MIFNKALTLVALLTLALSPVSIPMPAVRVQAQAAQDQNAAEAFTPGWTVSGDHSSIALGYAVNTAGDVNGDGYSDILVSAPFTANGQEDEGLVYLFLGSAAGPASTPQSILEINQFSAYFGESLAPAGDVNCDGFGDVIIGATGYDNTEYNQGGAFIFNGSPNGLQLTPSWSVSSTQAFTNFGQSVSSAGDINGDGCSDVMVGEPGYTNGQTREGAAYVYYGDPEGLHSTADLVIEGNQDHAAFGHTVASAGDVNKDGFGDVLVGAPGYANGELGEGAVFLYYGSDGGLLLNNRWMDESNQANAYLGDTASTAGDYNGDGFSDILVSAGDYDRKAPNGAVSYLYFGSFSGPGGKSLILPDIIDHGDSIEKPVSYAGDIDGDGFGDLLIGAPNFDNYTGAVYISFGIRLYPSMIHISDGIQEDFPVSNRFGKAVSTAGDVNGDGYGDFLVGAPSYDGPGLDASGKAYLYYGRPDPPSETIRTYMHGNGGGSVSSAGDINGDGSSEVIFGARNYSLSENLEGQVAVLYPQGNPSWWSAESNIANAQLGASVASAGDVNCDGYDDILAGAPGYATRQVSGGAVYLYYGSPGGLGPAPARIIEGLVPGALFGSSVQQAGDVNGDGCGDVIIGAPYFTHEMTHEGAAYVYYGSAQGLNDVPNMRIEGNQEEAQLGASVSTAGDVNRDGYSDVIIGAPGYDNGQDDEGRAIVYLGSPTGLKGPAAWTGESNQAFALFGSSVSAAGDLNGDGYSDVIIGAPTYSGVQVKNGAVFVYFGSVNGLYPSPGWASQGQQAYGNYGGAVSSAGDVNGDGFSDLLIGMPGFGLNQGSYTNRGAVYLFFGSSTGLPAASDWKMEGIENNAVFGASVSSGGDMNGDGYADFIAGAPYAVHPISPGFGEVRTFLGDGNMPSGTVMETGLLPRQMRAANPPVPIALRGRGDSDSSFTICLDGQTPLGSTIGKLEWQAAPLRTLFTAGSGVIHGESVSWRRIYNNTMCETVTGLKPGTAYHWRARLRYSPVTGYLPPASRWITIPVNGWNETDLRTSGNPPIPLYLPALWK